MRNEREMMWWRERETIEFWWCSYRNSYPKCNLPRRSAQKGERKIGIVCGNGVAKIVTEREKKIKAMELPKLWERGKKKELWQLSCPKCWGGKNKRKELWLAKTGEKEKRIVAIFFFFFWEGELWKLRCWKCRREKINK